MNSKLLDRLRKRQQEGTYRSLSFLKKGNIDFYSNDYLGLSKIETFENKVNFGSTGSRLISGNSDEAVKCEKFLSEFFGTESALVFNSGYDANLGLFSSLPQRGDTIIYDEYIHASIRDGIRLSLANSYSFEHNSVDDLRSKLGKAQGSVYIAVESLYSMDGDMAPLYQIAKLSKEFSAYLIVDEAHACGVFGEKGKGICDALDLKEKVFVRVVTFGKAYGSHGAAILGSANLTNYLINFARSFIYTTALPGFAYQRIQNIVGFSENEERQKTLHQNISYFRKLGKDLDLSSEVNSPIQIIRFSEIDKLKIIEHSLLQNDISIKAIYSPTVNPGNECLRICIHSFNTNEQIEKLVRIISSSL